MNKKNRFLIIIFIAISFSVIPSANAAQITANINPENSQSQFTAKYHVTVQIEYDEGGEIKDILKDKDWTIRKTADATDPDSMEIVAKLNQKISQDGSNARISGLSVIYETTLSGKLNSASVDYSVMLTGTLSDYVILPYSSDASRYALVDMGWRGLSVIGPVLIDGYDINLPISAIMEKEPEVYSLMESYPKVIDLLSENIIDAEYIMHTPLTEWHFLFDPTGINVDESQFRLTEEISGYVVSSYTMGESSIREGRQIERVYEVPFTADKNYVIRAVQSPDNANLNIIGFAAIDFLDGIEVLGVTPLPPEGFSVTSTGDAPFAMVYGLPIALTVAAAIIGYFLFKKGTTFF